MTYNEEVYVTKEQEQQYDLLVTLSNTISDIILTNRKNVIEVLLDDTLLVSNKKAILNKYVYKKLNFESQTVRIDDIEYSFSEIEVLASKLYNDSSFYGNELPYVINGLAFYENSISFEDIIIAFHNFRFRHDEESLWYLSLLLCRYIYIVLSMDSICRNISFESTESIDEIKSLVTYVVDFWNLHLKDVFVEPYKLVDDKRSTFYDKIDLDADYCFLSEDTPNEIKKKQIKAKYASKLISQCTKTLYLLMSCLKEIANNIDEADFSSELKKLRKVIIDVCEDIYCEEDAYGELENDKRLNSDRMRLAEKDCEISLLKYNLQCAIEKMKGYDTEKTLQKRQEALQSIRLLDSEQIIEEFVSEFSNLLMQSIPDSLETYHARLKSELGTKYDLLPEVALNTLASAEYLYDKFVKKQAPAGFDYSGIAVLYFQAFETAYDKLLIEPYAKWLEDKEVKDLYKERSRIKKKRRDKRPPKEHEQLEDIETKLKTYFSSKFNVDLFYYGGELVKCLEIGKFHRFIDLKEDILSDNETGRNLQIFLKESCFMKKIDAEQIDLFAQAVKNATNPRNKAAHGLHGLDEKDVREDKVIVYDETNIKDVQEFKNILYAFLDFYHS